MSTLFPFFQNKEKLPSEPETTTVAIPASHAVMTADTPEDVCTVLAFIQIDNLDDVMQGLEDKFRNAVLMEVNARLLKWGTRMHGFLKKYAEDSYLGVFSRVDLLRMQQEKFDILDEIRALRVGNKIPITLSMGLAAGDLDVTQLGDKAQTGLDLALGRGGDQAAVCINGEVQFYGGKAKVIEKSTRVKARVVAHAIRELMQAADQVLIMGHEREDFDSLGASLGIVRMARHIGITARIVVGEPSLAFEKLQEVLPGYLEYRDLFCSKHEANNLATSATLLVVVDTHRPEMTASPELLKVVERKVVIDHHRRSEDFIVNPLIVYLEPSASSTSELVTELLTYFDEKLELTQVEASALYAGIVVDTKNFAVQTGIRTFEAAAYLRRAGADPVLVRHLFRLDMETMKVRAAILTGAELLPGGVALATCPDQTKNIQIVAAQTADILLNTEGVRVSFVLFPDEGGVGISARSTGEINVQVIMEQFGGGGHQTVAGAHLDNKSVEEARQQLRVILSDYIEEGEVE